MAAAAVSYSLPHRLVGFQGIAIRGRAGQGRGGRAGKKGRQGGNEEKKGRDSGEVREGKAGFIRCFWGGGSLRLGLALTLKKELGTLVMVIDRARQ